MAADIFLASENKGVALIGIEKEITTEKQENKNTI
jgi:hypothetical protein